MAGIDSYVKLYSDFNSAIQDDFNGKSLTANGSASISTSVKKFGAGSLELSSSTSDYVSIPDDSDFNLGSGNFCFDFWVRFKTLPSAGSSMCFFTQWGVLTRAINCRITNTSGKYYFNFDYSTNGIDGYNTSSFYPFVIDTWYHLAIDRNDDYLTLFVDGKVLISTQHLGRTIFNSSDSFLIGAQTGGSFYLNGYIDSFRFSKGISRYEHTAFTPPTSNNTATSEDVILAHMDGSDESTTFTDSSTTNPKTITANGNAKLKTSVSFTPKIGTGSAKCVETSSYMSIPGSSDFNFGTGDYTIECWILIENLTERISIWDMYNGSSIGHFIRFNQGGNKEIYVSHNLTTVVTSSNNAINDNDWHHVAIVNNSGTVTIYVDGTSVGSGSAGANTAGNSTNTVYISSEWNADTTDFNLNGYIDEFRVSNNARYTTSFTPSTTAFSNDGNTKLLLHLDSDFSDSSSSAHTVTSGGSISIANSSTINPKCGTAMGYFKTSGDYLSISDNSDFALSSNDFLLESWIYPTSINAINFIWGQRVGVSNSVSIWVYFDSTTIYVINDLTNLTLTYTINADEWTHIAVFRISDKIFLAINGIILKVEYITGSMTDSTAEFRIVQASESASYRLNGYMDEFRMTNTSSQYDLVSFTAPTEEYTVPDQCANGLDAYVKLYCNFNGTDGSTTLLDDYGDKTLTANGNAQLDTAQKKFGSASLLLDGTTDYVTISDDADFNLGGGNWTFDFHVRFNTLPSGGGVVFDGLFGSWDTGNKGYAFEIDNSNYLVFFYTTDGTTEKVFRPVRTHGMVVDTWYHIAIQRNDTLIQYFIDGVCVGSQYVGTDVIYNSSADFKIGGVNANFLDGWIDEFRFSKGIARYSTNIQTSEFTDDANTTLLMNMNGSDGSTTFTDDSSTGNTFTVNGDSQLKTSDGGVSPKFGSAMAKFDGTGDYLDITSYSNFNFGSNDWTSEWWEYRNTSADKETSLGNGGSGTGWLLNYDAGGSASYNYLYWTTGTVAYTLNDNAPPTGRWVHYIVQRDGNNLYGWIDGGLTLSADVTGKTLKNWTDMEIAGRFSSVTLDGYMDEIRISDIARYDLASFTVPTTEYSICTGDSDAPVITALDPESGDQQIALTKTLEITFDENVIAQSGKNITIYDQGANIFEQIDVTNAKVTVTDNVVTINPAGIFQYGTLYYVLLDAGAFKDASGNPTSAITDPAYWNFLTKINNFSDAVIEIGGVDYTNQADLKSCRIIKQDNFDNQATVNIVMNTNAIKMGMEMKIRDTVTSEILFGGLIRDPQKVLLNPDFMVLKITADGYKQILGRRTFSVDVQNDLAGNTISQIFDDYLVTGGTYTDEGLSEGNIDNGATIENYVTIAKSGLKIFNDFANASGYKWWITDDKDFYFQSAPTYIDNTTTKKLTPDKTDSAYIRCVDMPVFNEDSSQFRTRQFVVGKTKDDTTILGSYTDSTAETEMASRYGSGVYGSVMTSRDISTTAEANTLAETEVKTYVNPASINFKTFDKIEPLELIKVDISLLGISNETYKITKVTKTIQPDFRILSDIVAEKYVASTKTKRNWTDDFDEMIKNNSADEDDKEIKYDEIVGGTSITSVAPDTRTLSMTVDTDKTLNIGYSIVGTCAVASTITVTVAIDAVTKKVFTWDVPIGNFSKEIYFPIRTITTSKSGASITAVTSTTQTLTIAGTDLTFWASLS